MADEQPREVQALVIDNGSGKEWIFKSHTKPI
jgi:hypothetical protein